MTVPRKPKWAPRDLSQVLAIGTACLCLLFLLLILVLGAVMGYVDVSAGRESTESILAEIVPLVALGGGLLGCATILFKMIKVALKRNPDNNVAPNG